MMDMLICGSCYTLVKVENLATKCPRCGEDMNPDARSILRRFADQGLVETNQKGGVPLRKAQEAAKAVLRELEDII